MLLIGAGGAGIAVADALLQAGIAELRLCESDPARAAGALQTLAARSGVPVSLAAADGDGCDLVVNATLLGTGADDPLPLDPQTLGAGAVVADLACGPGGSTALADAARARGCLAISGAQIFEAMCDTVGRFFVPPGSPAAPHSPPPPPQQAADRLRHLLNGYQATQTLHAAARLAVADHLSATTPAAVEELAVAVGAQPQPLYRLLRALAALEVFREHEGRRFSLAPMGACLRSDAPQSLRAWASFLGEASRWRAWGHLSDSVRTGSYAFEAVHGMDCWQYRRRHPEAAELFHAAMTSNSSRIDQAVLAACDLRGRHHLGDIGGGRGSLLAAALAADPSLQGTLFDQPEVIATAEPLLTAAGVRQRCRLVGGDFFTAIPAGCDALLLKFILHDWNDDQAIALLRSCRRAVVAGAVLFVAEYLVGPPNTGLHIKMSDLNMFVGTGGRERNEGEYADLLARAGFRWQQSVPTDGLLSVLVAEAV
ncbi:MAG: methyltransferase [Cyanobium sp.]